MTTDLIFNILEVCKRQSNYMRENFQLKKLQSGRKAIVSPIHTNPDNFSCVSYSIACENLISFTVKF